MLKYMLKLLYVDDDNNNRRFTAIIQVNMR